MKELTMLEQIILVSIVSLEEGAFGVAIRRKVKELAGKSLMYGTLYNALDQLWRKGYIKKTQGIRPEEKGAHGRVYYKLSPSGRQALQKAYELHKSIWSSIPDTVREYES